ncbi:hypothetical protein M231_02561 [Tremella mesenterica]|uniref:GST N-terminal domain-containing protein n=1 Tax=Tremella mesenterica TaxID=5217 RepID=A0A4Q1BQA6_TREME|nr:uncharacterized protein TREMEDRAFT_61290 [Tremella mesenterica DSM 1558]EIW70783.1 hypothetical protein TREMEDRAFT_61290 [Tremella mesenterica DSM 1558]RXK40104.1 hypothetical protein M231_02561 [Tremella mesenterica]
MSNNEKMVLYGFAPSVWANVPRVALTELGFKEGEDFETISIDLSKGENFNPDFLKINPSATVPVLKLGDKVYTDTATIVPALVALSPHPPQTSEGVSTSIIEETHLMSHDPNAMLLMARDEDDYAEKKKGMAFGFASGRQEGLDKYAPLAPSELKEFVENKQKSNQALLDFYQGTPDEQTRKTHFTQAKALWTSAGIFIRGVLTQAIKKTPGAFVGGETPSQEDYHIIVWLARVVTDASLPPQSPSSSVIPRLQELMGGHEFDPVIKAYWDAWLARDSFVKNNVF